MAAKEAGLLEIRTKDTPFSCPVFGCTRIGFERPTEASFVESSWFGCSATEACISDLHGSKRSRATGNKKEGHPVFVSGFRMYSYRIRKTHRSLVRG